MKMKYYRKVHSDGPPVIKLDRLYYPLFDFDIDKYGVWKWKTHLGWVFEGHIVNIKVR